MEEVFVPLIGSNCLLRISGFVLNVQFLFYFIFFLRKICVVCSEKPKANRRVMTPLQVQERSREWSTQVSNRSEQGMAAANALL